MNKISKSMFREYDIRGIAETELQDDVVERVASAFAAVFIRDGGGKIAVGMDGRPSSHRIKNIVIDNLVKYGLEVLDIGLVPTPLMYFAVFWKNLSGGIIITA